MNDLLQPFSLEGKVALVTGASSRQACGQSVADLTASKLDRLLDKQERELRKRFGDSQVRFKVVVENGRAKLTASRRG